MKNEQKKVGVVIIYVFIVYMVIIVVSLFGSVIIVWEMLFKVY